MLLPQLFLLVLMLLQMLLILPLRLWRLWAHRLIRQALLWR